MDILPPLKKHVPGRPVGPVIPPPKPAVQHRPPLSPVPQLSIAADKPRKPRWLLRGILLVTGLVLIIAASLGGWYWYNLQPVNSTDTTRRSAKITSGMSDSDIGTLLQQAGLIRSAEVFRVYNDLNGTKNKLQAGTYRFSPNQTVAQIVQDLVAGKTDAFNVTIPPGATLGQVKNILLTAGFSGDSIDVAFTAHYSSPVLATRPAEATLEGYLFPETYQVDDTTTAQSFIGRAIDQLQTELSTHGLQQQFASQGLTVHQALTLASIVAKESSLASDQKQIAQVFLLRLQRGMLLETDTVPSTYEQPGLPIQPIGAVSLAALQAVGAPAPGDYLYFVADDNSASSHFAHTLDEQSANIARYCKVKCASN